LALATLAIITTFLTEVGDTDLTLLCAMLIILAVGVLNARGGAEEEEHAEGE
jgi:hypothetical protein